MAVEFPSLAFFQALQQRTKEEHARFEKLGYCDTSFGVKVGDRLYSVAFEVYECVDVGEGGDPSQLDFVLAGSLETWREMLRSILDHGGADAAHTLNTLTHLGTTLVVEFEDAEGHDKLFRYMASLQEFFDQARHVDVALAPE
jgi:hypothetical protein